MRNSTGLPCPAKNPIWGDKELFKLFCIIGVTQSDLYFKPITPRFKLTDQLMRWKRGISGIF